MRMAFVFRLKTADGAPADPPTLNTAGPNCSEGDCVPLGKRTLRVIGKRDDDADQAPILVVEDVASSQARAPEMLGTIRNSYAPRAAYPGCSGCLLGLWAG
jgi:hypothetical protein